MIPDFGFYNMDCMEGMKQFPDKYFELAIVDPPYGINIGSEPGGQQTNHPVRRKAKRQIQIGGANPFGGRYKSGGLCKPPKTYKAFDDSHTPDAEYFKELERVAKHRIIWGG